MTRKFKLASLFAASIAAFLFAACSGGSSGPSFTPDSKAAARRPAASGTITESGTITAMLTHGFQLYPGPSCGHINVYTNASTVFSGPAPTKNAQVKVVGTGSCTTSITATSVAVGGATPSPSPSPDPTPTPGGSILWQVGDSEITANTGQCGAPAISGSSVDFVLDRNPGCMRNQLNPVGNGGSGTYMLNAGQTYEWDFQTVTHMGIDTGQYTQRLIWQEHDYACGNSPLTVLGIENMAGGSSGQTWYWQTAGKTFTMPYTEGATDTWRVVITIDSTSAGVEELDRNGVAIAKTTGANFACGAKPWWNFGPYMWDWTNGNAVSSLTSVEIFFNYMTLSAP